MIFNQERVGSLPNARIFFFQTIPSWDDFTFLPGTLTRFFDRRFPGKVSDRDRNWSQAKRPLVLDIPVYVTGMSFGALSYEAKTALAEAPQWQALRLVLGRGMIPDERRYSSKWFYQCIQSRYGFNPHHLQFPSVRVFFWARLQGGVGWSSDGAEGYGPGCRDAIIASRGSISVHPLVTPRVWGPDDLALKIEEIRRRQGEIPIQLKLGAARVYDDVRMAAKTGPDSIYIDGGKGGTGAGPHWQQKRPVCRALRPFGRPERR
ncbi:MAG: hypothetical protein CM1200mP41_10340 [Gammaproteobacteria bacterium]|nr:MAG: hypothetical protein CM1200mP41_10340 [Gammaproteobacteria bacterium]